MDRVCTRCGERKPLADFPSNGGGALRPHCRPCHASQSRTRYHANKPAAQKQQRAYRLACGAGWSERNRIWRDANPDYYQRNIATLRPAGRIKAARRRARIAGVEHERIEPTTVYERSMGLCGICGLAVSRDSFQMDHVVPIAAGGAHVYENLQAAHPLCNQRKGARCS